MMLKTQPSLRFSGYIDNWSIKKLREVSSIKSGATPARSNPKYFDEGSIPWVKTTDLNNSLITSTEELITDKAIQETSVKILPVDTILIAMYGGFNQIGRTGMLSVEATTNQALSALISKNHLLLPMYLLIWLNAKVNLWRRFAASSRKDPNITGRDVADFPIAFPCIEEQKRISAFFSAIDIKISQLKEKQTLLQQYKKGVMQQLYNQQIRFNDDNGNEFPEWQVKSLSELLTMELREVKKPKEKYLAIGIRSHMKGTFQKPEFNPDSIVMEKLYVVKHNDLIVNITFAWEGAIAIVKTEDDGGLVSHRFPTYTFKKEQALHEYFRHVILQKRFKYMLDLISPGGAGRNRVLSKKEFLKLKWNMPCVEEQKKIAAFFRLSRQKNRSSCRAN